MAQKSSTDRKSLRKGGAAQAHARSDEPLLHELVSTLARVAARHEHGKTDPAEAERSSTSEQRPHAKKRRRRVVREAGQRMSDHVSRRPSEHADEDTVGSSGGADDAAGAGTFERPLTVREIAAFLGVSEDVARDLLRKQKIAGFRVGGQWRAMPSAVSEFIIAQLAK